MPSNPRSHPRVAPSRRIRTGADIAGRSATSILLALLLAACAGPSRNSLADTPTATTRRPPSLAPPASGEDKERYQLNQQFEDMRDAQQAHREAEGATAPPPAANAPGTPAPTAKRKPAPPREPAPQ